MAGEFLANYLGMVRLGSTRLSVGANTTSIVSWAGLFEQLIVLVAIPSYAGSDVGSLQFGNTQGVVDTGANYWNRTVSLAAGTVTPLVDAPQAADTLIRLGLPTNLGRSAWIHVTNFATKTKVAKVQTAIGTASTAVGAAQLSVEGEWNNTTAPIQSMLMKTPGGTNMGVGTQFIVFGLIP